MTYTKKTTTYKNQMCNIIKITLEVLSKGNVKQTPMIDIKAYQRERNNKLNKII
jgi:hypothetical protein